MVNFNQVVTAQFITFYIETIIFNYGTYSFVASNHHIKNFRGLEEIRNFPFKYFNVHNHIVNHTLI